MLSIDVEKLLASLDTNTLEALSKAIDEQKQASSKEEEEKEFKQAKEEFEAAKEEFEKQHANDEPANEKELTQEEMQKILEEKGSISKTRTVKPRIYYETIQPDEWNYVGGFWQHTREIYTDEYQLRESALLELSLDEDKMMSSYKTEHFDTGEDRAVYIRDIEKFIDMIYDEALIKIKSDNIIGTFTYSGKYRPKFPISVVITELPFLDCPASSMGL